MYERVRANTQKKCCLKTAILNQKVSFLIKIYYLLNILEKGITFFLEKKKQIV